MPCTAKLIFTFLPLSAGRALVSLRCTSYAFKPLATNKQLMKVPEDAVELFGKDHEYTKLIINHENVDPEDVYSQIAYEKGFHFLYYLECVVGRPNFDKFIVFYFTKWSEKSLDSFEFRDTFMDFFNNYGDGEIKENISKIDWHSKFYSPGLPPKPDFDTTLADMCYELADKWQDNVCHPIVTHTARTAS